MSAAEPTRLYNLDGEAFARVPIPVYNIRRATLGSFSTRRCTHCGRDEGTLHVRGCDWEICPRCRRCGHSCTCDDQAVPDYTLDEITEIAKRLANAIVRARNS